MLYKSHIETGAKKKGSTCLFIIDPQNDFIDEKGSLSIPNAMTDSVKTAAYILQEIDSIGEIYVSLDTHMQYHIAHPMFWVDEDGHHPAPFTQISLEDFQQKRWRPTREASDKGLQAWCERYLSDLAKNGKFNLTIWPPHCLIGDWGHNVVPVIASALKKWERLHNRTVNYILKGTNSLTEHYSALKAEIVHPEDPASDLNKDLLNGLKVHDNVVVCGQALSHCVNFTVRDMIDHWDANNVHQIKLLADCCSSVPGFEAEGQKFLEDAQKAGVRLIQSADFLSRSKRSSSKRSSTGRPRSQRQSVRGLLGLIFGN